MAKDNVEESKLWIDNERRVLYNSFMNAPAAIAILKGNTFIYEFANNEYEKLVDKKVTPGKTVQELFPEFEQQGIIAILDNVYSSAEPFIANEFPVEVSNTDGKLVLGYYNYVIQPIKDEQGNTESLLVHAVDVTQHIKARKQMEASEAFNRTVLESSPDCLKVLDGEGCIQYMNLNGLCQMEIDDFSAFKNKNWWTLWGSENEALVKAAVDKALTGETAQFTALCPTAKGTLKWWDVVVSPVGRPGETVHQIISVSRDITVQKEAEEKIKASEERYRSLFESMDQGFCIIEMIFDNNNNPVDYLFIEANPAFEKQSGIANPVGKTIRALVANMEERWFKIYGNVALTGEANHFIDYIEELSRWFEVSAFRLGDNESKKVAVLITNITERKQNEETLRYSKALLEAHNEANRDGLLLVDAKGKIISYNQSFIDVWRMPKEIVETENDELALEFAMSQLVNPQQFIDKVKWLYEHPSERSIDELEYLDGRIIERHGYSVFGEDGTYYAWSWTFRDITAQKTAAAAIIESENQFRTFADSIQNLAWIANADGWIYWYNQQWYDYTGTTFEEMEGWGWAKVHHPDHIEKVVEFVNEAWKKDEAFELTFPLRRHDGEFRWFLTRAYPVKNANGNIERWIGTNTDINDQKIKEQEKDDFISIASHEMKTPLTVAKGYIQLLQQSIKDDTQTVFYAGKVNQAIHSLDVLITELLDASKIQNGQMNYNITTFDFNKLVDETIEDFQHSSKNHRLEKTGNCSQQITGDKNRLQQVLINLLSNAIKYSPQGDKVLIKIEEQDKQIKVSVQDFGIGMSTQHLDKIFGRYYRVKEHEAHFHGLGIGLYISQNIIERHNGAMWVQSEPAKGSIFYFTVPVSPGSS